DARPRLAPWKVPHETQLLPAAASIGLLVNPTNPFAEALSRDAQAAASTFGLQLHVLQASTEHDFDTVFARLVELRVCALWIGPDALFTNGSDKLATLMLRYALPAIYSVREFAVAGGLMSYGPVLRMRGVSWATTLAVFLRARTPLTCRFSKSRRSSWS